MSESVRGFWGSGWGSSPWAGTTVSQGKTLDVSITGTVRICLVSDNSINGTVRIAKNVTRTVTGIVRVEKTTSKTITG